MGGDAGYRMYEKGSRKSEKAKPLSFKADTSALRQWVGKRRDSLFRIRQEFEELWKEIRLYFEPNIGKALLDYRDRDDAASRREDEKIVNSEPRLCVERYSAGMQSGITNKAQKWCAIVPKLIDEEESRDPELNDWCNQATDEILSALERANFYRTSQRVYPHGALLGTSCVMIFRGADPGDIYFHLIDEGDYWIAEDRYGNVTQLMRRMPMTVGQAREQFLLGNLPQAWRRMIADGKLEERVEVWNLVCPNDGSEKFKDIDPKRPWASIYWTTDTGSDDESGNNGILDISSFSYKPMAVLRQKESGSVYGKGIGEMSLPDCKELQSLEEYELRMIANEAEPAMLAPSSMKGKPINMFPGGITFYDGITGAGASPITRLYALQEGIDKVDAKIQVIMDRIGRMWFNDLFAMMLQINQANRNQKTATEISELSGEKVTLLGPVLTQMDEFLNAVIDAVFTILLEDGVIPDPPAVLVQGGASISVEYTSTIHSEMKAALKMRAINMLIEMTSMLAQANPESIDKVDTDKIIDEVCKVYPGSAAYVRNSKEVQAIREMRQQAQDQQMQQQQYVEMMKNAGQNAKALSETKVGNGNALELLMASGGAG